MEENLRTKIFELAHREALEYVRGFISAIELNKGSAKFFLNLYAPNEFFGRSELLERLHVEYGTGRVLPSGLVRMADFRVGESGQVDIAELLIQVIREMSANLSNWALPTELEVLSTTQLIEYFSELISAARSFGKVVLLLIDDYDLVSLDQRVWLQDNVLALASSFQNFVVILATENELQFSENFNLRIHLEAIGLRGLKAEHIALAFPAFREITEEIFRITGGIPEISVQFTEYLESFHVSTSADFQLHAREFTANFYDTRLNEIFFSKLPSQVSEAMLILATLRRFDVQVLKRILPALRHEEYQDYGNPDFLALLGRLRPWAEKYPLGGSTLKLSLRIMLQSYVSMVDPTLFEQANEMGVSIYRGWLETSYRQDYLKEWLYHLATLSKIRKSNRYLYAFDTINRVKLDKELLSYLQSDIGQQIGMRELDSLPRILKEDQDLASCVSVNFPQKLRKLIAERDQARAYNGIKAGLMTS